MQTEQSRFEDEADVFREHGGTLRFSQALDEGITEYRLRKMLEEGVVERLSRGLYRLTELPPLAEPDLVIAARRIPRGVVCLISALSFHDITQQVPHELMLALDQSRQRQEPRLDHPPVRFFWFSHETHSAGVVEHEIDGVPVKVYSPEKTIADCFKFRNTVGLDVAIEGLQLLHERNGVNVDDLMDYARICRVQDVIRPYLEATL
ncbi:MAG: type IV toxin-antitoxin system AbiEi family antitoxin domain-containing protein [Armatimonadota bacterium]